MILKLGSVGDAVKQLQQRLGVTVDGQFGVKTEQAVKNYQSLHGLTADGIVGDKTWASLFNVDDFITYSPLTVHVSKLPNRDIKYIVIHFTAGTSSKPGRALNTKQVFTQRSASADFCVDDDSIIQFNPDIKNYYCWAVGDKLKPSVCGGKYNKAANNRNTINIEMCSTCTPATSQGISYANHDGWSLTPAVLSNTKKLIQSLMSQYNIDRDHVIRHYDVTGKPCPGVIGWNDEPIVDIYNKKTGKNSTSATWESFQNSL